MIPRLRFPRAKGRAHFQCLTWWKAENSFRKPWFESRPLRSTEPFTR
jgi:hypothetical protein